MEADRGLLKSLLDQNTGIPEELLLKALLSDARNQIRVGCVTNTPYLVQRAHECARWLMSSHPYYYVSLWEWSDKRGFKERTYRETPLISSKYIFEYFDVNQQAWIDEYVLKYTGIKNIEYLRDKWRIMKGDFTII